MTERNEDIVTTLDDGLADDVCDPITRIANALESIAESLHGMATNTDWIEQHLWAEKHAVRRRVPGAGRSARPA